MSAFNHIDEKDSIMGTLYCRKRRGKKRQFIIGGGFDVSQIVDGIRWAEVDKNLVFEFHGSEGTFTLLPPKYWQASA